MMYSRIAILLVRIERLIWLSGMQAIYDVNCADVVADALPDTVSSDSACQKLFQRAEENDAVIVLEQLRVTKQHVSRTEC